MKLFGDIFFDERCVYYKLKRSSCRQVSDFLAKKNGIVHIEETKCDFFYLNFKAEVLIHLN